MHAIQAREPGTANVLAYVSVPDPEPGPGEVLVQVAAAGVNFIDTYRRSGIYRMPFPHLVGSEGAGTITALGPDVTEFEIGQRVAWCDGPGSYAEYVTLSANRLLAVPDAVPLDVAAALVLQGITAHYLVNSTYPVAADDPILLHAGAGGVGLLATQLATSRGGHVLTTVSTDEKAELSKTAGAVAVIRYDQLNDLTAELPGLVRGHFGGGVAVAYDGVGRTTFDASLACLRRRGMLVLFGGASGQVPPFELQRLNAAGSVYVTRPSIGDYIVTTEELRWRGRELFAAVSTGQLVVRIGARFPLAEAAEAHRRLEGRQTTGKVILDVS